MGHYTPWEDRQVLYHLARVNKPDIIVEVGCYVGMSTIALARACPTATIHCVDTFGGNADDRLGVKNPTETFRAFCDNMGDRLFSTVFPHQGTSRLYGAIWPFLVDFVFIDAGHSYQSCRRDIESWLPRIRPGGILCGHDYCTEFPGVVQAADEIGIDGHSARIWWKRIQ